MRVGRPIRVLFFPGEPAFLLRQYSSLVALLAEREHDVELAFTRPPEAEEARLLDRLGGGAGRVSHSVAPRREQSDGWRSVAWAVRGVGDLARYADPRYVSAPRLRSRLEGKVVGRLERPGQLEPLARRLALRTARRLASARDAALSARVIRAAARLEDAIPTCAAIDEFIRERAPDVVLVTPVVAYGSEQVEFLKSARRLGIPAATCVASWDNLTNKGLLKWIPERVFVWNEIQRREAVELHGIPTERVVATGAQLFDEWFERRPSRSREQFVREVGLDPAQPYLLYLCSSKFITEPGEVDFVLRWLEALRSSGEERLRRAGVVVRPHPSNAQEWRDVELARAGNAAVWPREALHPVAGQPRAEFFDTLVHSAAVVGINTTAMIEAAVVEKSVLTVLAPEFAQESTLHFHYLLEENGGFLHVASSLDDHLGQLARALNEDSAEVERRRAFVASFVRPHGLDRPATPILADAVEELAGLPVEAPARRPLLRAVLSVEAALSSVAIVKPRVARRLGRLRRRVVGKARRYRPLLLRSGVEGD